MEAMSAIPPKGSSAAEKLYIVSSELRRTSDLLQKRRDLETLMFEDLDRKIRLARDPGVASKFDLLISELARRSGYPGAAVNFDTENDFSTLCAKTSHEALFYIRSLKDLGMLVYANPAILTLTAKAWSRLDELRTVGGHSKVAFVAMWFDSSMKAVDEAIDEAISTAGFTPLRIDRHEHVNRIDDEILAQIRRSRFLVADFTGHRSGVYFEAGFMLGLGRPVIWCCSKEQLIETHFDTRQYNTIDYASPEELKRRLTFRIEALLGHGSTAI